jgi:2-succinyl-5-enolpyruvyl-6-hydroxy-3-cyclohexene-1-carboxylate synthase
MPSGTTTFRPHLKVIVIDNGGGNIFRYIDGPDQDPELLHWFEAPHTRSIEKLVKSFDCHTTTPTIRLRWRPGWTSCTRNTKSQPFSTSPQTRSPHRKCCATTLINSALHERCASVAFVASSRSNCIP